MWQFGLVRVGSGWLGLVVLLGLVLYFGIGIALASRIHEDPDKPGDGVATDGARIATVIVWPLLLAIFLCVWVVLWFLPRDRKGHGYSASRSDERRCTSPACECDDWKGGCQK